MSSQFSPMTQPPQMQIPHSDPFHHKRDPFMASSHHRVESGDPHARAWTPSSSTGHHHITAAASAPPPPPPPPLPRSSSIISPPFSANAQPFHRSHSPPTQQQPSHAYSQHQIGHHHDARPIHHPLSGRPPTPSQSAPPPPNGLGMPPPPYEPYDTVRRRSLGAASPPRFQSEPSARHQEPRHNGLPPAQTISAFNPRQMPPPSPTQHHAASTSHLHAAPRGPPTSSPFPGMRDFTSSRPSGMSIGSLLGRDEDRRPNGSPYQGSAAYSPPGSAAMQPPSPGRARSASVRETIYRPVRGSSPHGVVHDRGGMQSHPRREDSFGSPPRHDGTSRVFRAYQPEGAQGASHAGSGLPSPMRPNSQPIDYGGIRAGKDFQRNGSSSDAHLGLFRFDSKPPPPKREEGLFRHERGSSHGGPSFQSQDRTTSGPGHFERDHYLAGPSRGLSGPYPAVSREEHVGGFRPAYAVHSAGDVAREAVETRQIDHRHHTPRRTPPPPSGPARYDHGDLPAYTERPATLEDPQRMAQELREQQMHARKDYEPTHRAILNISPVLDRKGRSSPLPQAVQGAQPRHVGPGGDNPGIKSEFGRMFAGLGAGVGSATPQPAYPVNGASTPSRMSPARVSDNNDTHRAGHSEAEAGKKVGARGAKKNSRRPRDEVEKADGEGRITPDQRMGKRVKSAHHHHHHVHPHHHHHHHHHHHLEPTEASPGSYNTMRLSSNPSPQANGSSAPPHNHHHHHHAHPASDTHSAASNRTANVVAPAQRMPTLTVVNREVMDWCANKPRKHLGSQLYTTEVTTAPAADTPFDAKIKFSSKVRPIPYFEGKENCTFTIRVPRYYLSSSGQESHEPNWSFEEICRRREVWGTDIYTDDSDPIAAAIHSGWIQGEFGDYGEDIRQLQADGHDIAKQRSAKKENKDADVSYLLESMPSQPVRVPEGFDAHITVLILPPLAKYSSSHRHHLLSREWPGTHDGMSIAIHKIEFVEEGPGSRFAERGAASRKHRIALEEAKRRDAAASLLMFAATASNGGSNGVVRVGA